jgi:hypothetical protein
MGLPIMVDADAKDPRGLVENAGSAGECTGMGCPRLRLVGPRSSMSSEITTLAIAIPRACAVGAPASRPHQGCWACASTMMRSRSTYSALAAATPSALYWRYTFTRDHTK